MIDDFKLNCELVCNKYNLFADDDSYQEFRQSIINAPIFSYDKSKLPFEDIKLVKSTLDFDVKLEFQFLMHSLMPSTSYPNKHLFYIYKSGICRAYGYFVPYTNYFVICEGSLVSLSVDSRYEETTSGNARVRFIREACEAYPNYYRVKKDAKCISATAAASYVLGRTARYTDWKDENGELLSKFYPTYFKKKTINSINSIEDVNVSSEKTSTHLFYLKIGSKSNLYCYAIGEYNIQTKQLTLKANSILANINNSTHYKRNYYNRSNIINRYTEKKNNLIYLKQDLVYNSPNEAATIVIGEISDGWTLWRDSQNRSIYELYKW